MRKTYRTLEEVRKQARERQARWREKNRGYERTRAKNNYAKRTGGGTGLAMGGDADGGRGIEAGIEVGDGGANEVASADVGTRESDGVSGACNESGELRYEPIEGWDTPDAEHRARAEVYRRRRRGLGLMEPNYGGGHGDTKNMGQTGERGFGEVGITGQSANEKATLERLEEFKAKRRAREAKGVKVKVEME